MENPGRQRWRSAHTHTHGGECCCNVWWMGGLLNEEKKKGGGMGGKEQKLKRISNNQRERAHCWRSFMYAPVHPRCTLKFTQVWDEPARVIVDLLLFLFVLHSRWFINPGPLPGRLPPVFDWFPRVLIKNGEEGGGGYEMNPLGF